jgi:hypothetical protein
VILFYEGYDDSPIAQYVALAALAGVLGRFRALVVLNECGHTSLPVALLADDHEQDKMEFLQSLPIPILYCGFVKYEVEDTPGVWFRTHGANLLGFPDLAAHGSGHQEGQRYFDIFDTIYNYLREGDAELAPGHTMQLEEEDYFRFREPTQEEEFLDFETELLVVELINPAQINR